MVVTFYLVALTRIAETKYRPLCEGQSKKMQQEANKQTRFRPLCCCWGVKCAGKISAAEFCHRAVGDPRARMVGGLSTERRGMRVRLIAEKKSKAESTMGFLCMSPNGPLYGQNVWAMRIYASSSYSAPRCFTPTNSRTPFILLSSALKKTLDE